MTFPKMLAMLALPLIVSGQRLPVTAETRAAERYRHIPSPSADPGKASLLRDEALKLLNFCLANPDSCSMSINHISGGWQRHYNANRLNVIASGIKIIPLLAYGDAVANGSVSPSMPVHRDDWTRFQSLFFSDNSTFAWYYYGQPVTLPIDTMALAMMEISDNAVPDYLLNTLGKGAMENAIRQWVPGYVDVPQSIGAISVGWGQNPYEPRSARRLLDRYSGYGSHGYRKEVDDTFTAMHNPAVMNDIRQFTCYAPPWNPPPSPCTYNPFRWITVPEFGALTRDFWMRSNTRTYNNMMTGIMEGELLPNPMRGIVRQKLEWPMAYVTPGRFRHLAAKGGALADSLGYTIRTDTSYIETAAPAPGGGPRGNRAAVTIQLRGAKLDDFNDSIELFNVAMLEEPGFAEMVMARLPNDPDQPDLMAKVNSFDVTGSPASRSLNMQFDVVNLGTAASGKPVTVSLYASDDRTLGAGDRLLGSVQVGSVAGQASIPAAISASGVSGLNRFNYAILAVDSAGTLIELDRKNNVTWEGFPITASPSNPLDLTAPMSVTYSPVAGGFSVASGAVNFDANTGSALALGDDATVSVALPFAFPFQGASYRSMFVNSDGNITFGAGEVLQDRDAIQLVSGPPRVAGLLRDLDVTAGGSIKADVRADRVVVTWSGVPEYGTSNYNTFQITLFNTGVIRCSYPNVQSTKGVVGIAKGGKVGPYNEIDLTAQLPGTFAAGAIFEEFR